MDETPQFQLQCNKNFFALFLLFNDLLFCVEWQGYLTLEKGVFNQK